MLVAPSGTGKTTIQEMVHHAKPDFGVPVSCTTRLPRANEKHGVDYFFLNRESFERRIANGDFIEWELNYGMYYGTLYEELTRYVDYGRSVIPDLDIKGAVKLRNRWKMDRPKPHNVHLIFIAPPSVDALLKRLVRRDGVDAMRENLKRMETSITELHRADEADFIFMNDSLDVSVPRAVELMEMLMRGETPPAEIYRNPELIQLCKQAA